MKTKKIIFMVISLLFLMLTLFFMLILFNPYPLKYKEDIKNASNKFEIAPEIIASVINQESSFDKFAKSDAGAIGLMQILPSTAQWICKNNNIEYDINYLTDESFNIDIGTCYLRYLFNKFQDLKTTLVAYNAGEGNVMIWLMSNKYSQNNRTLISSPYPETNVYVDKVIRGIEVYKHKFSTI